MREVGYCLIDYFYVLSLFVYVKYFWRRFSGCFFVFIVLFFAVNDIHELC